MKECTPDVTFSPIRNPYTFKCMLLLNQVCAGLWLARTWFLKIDPVWIVGMLVRVCVCVCVCVSTPEAINS